jgi:hypothetical protein
MKNFAFSARMWVAILAIVASFSFASAAAKPTDELVSVDVFKALDVRVYKGNHQNAFRLAVANYTGSEFTIKIRNTKNELIWWATEKNKPTYTEVFDMAQLPKGEYTIEFINDMTSYTRSIVVE